MKLCIIGPEKKGKTEIGLLNEARKHFSRVFYAPYNKINIKQDKETSVNYKGKDISKFDAILPLIPRNHSMFGYFLLKSMDSFSLMKPSSFLMCYDRFLLMNILRKNDIPTPDLYLVESPEAALMMLEKHKIKFPISIRMHNKDQGIMIANSPKELKAILDTIETFKESVYMEEFDDSDYYQLLVLDDEVIACMKRTPRKKTDIYMSKGKVSECCENEKVEELALKAAKSVRTRLAIVDILEKPMKVVNINLRLKTLNMQKFSKNDLNKEIIDYVFESAKIKGKPLTRIDDFVREMKIAVRDIFE